jgi:penicillin-binding protein 1B
LTRAAPAAVDPDVTRSRFRRRRALLIGSGAAALVLAAIAALWVVHLDRVVTREFQGRHWSVPARVYATPLELYAGAPVSANDLEEQLRLLHYRRGDPSKGAGFYRRSGNAFDVHARRARFIDELREPELVSIHADSSSITSMRRADGSDLPVFRLDPAVIGSVFPVHGEDRLVIAPADVPPLLRQGIKVIEDRRFDEPHGVDV